MPGPLPRSVLLPQQVLEPSIYQSVGALKLVHHSSDKILHLVKVTFINAARTINQEDNVHLLI